MAILIPHTEDLRAKKIIRDRDGRIMLKGSTRQENMAIQNMHAPDNRAANMKQKLMIELK